MKTVKKYATFEDLKSSEEKTMEYKVSIKKHNEFERIIKMIYSIRVHKNVAPTSK